MAMARPRKNINFELMQNLIEQGFSTRYIASKLGVNQSTIVRLMQNRCKTDAKPPTDDKVEKHVNTNNSRESMPTKTTPPQVRTTTPHRVSYSVSYEGKQPTNSLAIYYGKNKNNSMSKYEGEDYTLLAHKRRIVIWLHNLEVENNEQLEQMGRGRARARLGQFAFTHNVKIDFRTLERKTDPHWIINDKELNELVMELITQEPELVKQLGIEPGDHSHKENVEFNKTEAYETFIHLVKKPKEFYEIEEKKVSALLEYSTKNIKDMEVLVQLIKKHERQLEMHDYLISRIENNLEEMTSIIANKRYKKLEN